MSLAGRALEQASARTVQREVDEEGTTGRDRQDI